MFSTVEIRCSRCGSVLSVVCECSVHAVAACFLQLKFGVHAVEVCFL